MGFYLRKSVAIGPFRFNLSGSGVGMSVGVRGLRVGSRPRGNYVRIGRGSVYYQQNFGGRTPERPLQEIASADAAQIVDSSSEQLVAELRDKQRMLRRMPLVAMGSVIVMLFAAALPAWAFVTLAIMAIVAIAAAHRGDVLRKTSVIVDYTWRYVNRSGGPDRRFSNNPRIPVCLYDELHFRTASGLHDVVQLSRSGLAEGFAAAVRHLGAVVK
ncbi:MAG TPA: DUF4236 domain-containing protein [Thermoanaerobaculia bacterium]|nr:DUF4236 domain-containing protein [Thermoanaerobaculia bacterium]